MKPRLKKIFFDILYAAIAIALVIAVWSIAAAMIGAPFILPTVGETFEALGGVLKNPAFWAGLGGTLLRSVFGFAISVACFFLLFFVCSVFEPCAKIIEPIISALRALPTLAVSLILAIWAGGYYAPVIIGVLVTLPYMYASVKARNAAVEPELKEICVMFGAGRVQTFKTLWLPHAAAGLPETLSSGLSFGIKAVIAAEILMQTADSLGQLMNLAKVYLETAMLIAFVFVAVIAAVVLEYLLKIVLRAALAKYR